MSGKIRKVILKIMHGVPIENLMTSSHLESAGEEEAVLASHFL